MVKNKYTFIQLSVKQRKMAFAELKYSQGKNDDKIRADIYGDGEADIDTYVPAHHGHPGPNGQTPIEEAEETIKKLREEVVYWKTKYYNKQ
jgi:hypothetical protein